MPLMVAIAPDTFAITAQLQFPGVAYACAGNWLVLCLEPSPKSQSKDGGMMVLVVRGTTAKVTGQPAG